MIYWIWQGTKMTEQKNGMNREISADGTYNLPVRVYYEDTDAGGIVYYANYLKFAERARTEYLRALGLEQNTDLAADQKIGFAVRHCEIDYRKPAVLDDLLNVSCKISELGGASCTMHQEISRADGLLLVCMEVKVVCMNLSKMRPVRLPENLTQKIEKYI